MRILVVDDERFNLKVAEGFLKSIPEVREIVLCNQPEMVMEIIEKQNIDIVLLDIVMPQITGIDLLREIRANRKYDDVQVIMLTSLSVSDSFKMCFEIGSNDYILKPINVLEFQPRLKAAIKARANALAIKTMLETVKQQNEELKHVNMKLKDTQFHLVQSGKMAAIGELAAGVAHEINNPIGYVSSNLETLSMYLGKIKDYILFINEKTSVMADLLESNQIREMVEEIAARRKKLKIDIIVDDFDNIIKDSTDGIDKVAEIVRNLRNFARTGLEDERSNCPLNEILKQVLLIVRNEAKYHVDFEVDCPENLEVWCNQGQIGQVLLNILVNGIQAIKSQERTDRGLIVIKGTSDGEHSYIRITDNGPGISNENLERIFNPFFTTKEVGQGTGLGLSISYDIVVKKHNGELTVNSELGNGTEFLIKLPNNSIGVE